MNSSSKDTFIHCIRFILRPVVRFALKRSISIQELIESLKVVCVETAADEIAEGGEKVTVSKIRVATGMHRRDVVRLYREGEEKDFGYNLLTRILGHWQQDKRFITKSRKPRVLSYEGDDSEFNRLVRSISVDVHPSSVLFELERIGAVTKGARGLKLVERGYRPVGDPLEAYKLLADDTEQLFSTVEENVFRGRRPANLHVKTEYDNISQTDVKKIQEWIFKEGSAFHQKARNFIAKYDLDINPSKKKKGGAKVVLTSFGRTVPK